MDLKEFKRLYKKFSSKTLDKSVWDSKEYSDYIDSMTDDDTIGDWYLRQQIKKSKVKVGRHCYIWKVKFKKGELKTIKVNYMVPSGVGYGGEYRFFKYLISTGTGWKDKINKAEINVRLNNVKANTIETISPSNHKLDDKTKTISWIFKNIEPTADNDIYVRYYIPNERRKWENFKEKRARQLGK